MKNQIKFFISVVLIFIVIISFDSCRKNFSLNEFDNLTTDSLHFEGSFAAPIVNTELTLINFLPKTDSSLWAEVDANNLIHLRMYFKNLLSPTFSEIYPLLITPAPAGTPVPADTFAIQTDTSKMKVYNKLLSGKLFFQNPSITFHIDNYIPIVTFFKIDTLTFHQSDGTALTHTSANEFSIAAPTVAGTSKHTDIVLDTTEVPLLSQVFSPVPQFISFYLSSGSHTTQTLPFAVTGDEKMNIDVDIDLPLDAKLDTIVMADTMNFTLFNDERIKSATLKIKFDNGFPIDGFTQIYFTDSTATGGVGNIIDSVFTDTNLINISDEGWHLEAAETDAQGIVTVSHESDIFIFLNQDRIKNLIQRHASKMIIRGNLNSYMQDTGLFIKILGDYTMGVQIAVKLDFEASTNNI